MEIYTSRNKSGPDRSFSDCHGFGTHPAEHLCSFAISMTFLYMKARGNYGMSWWNRFQNGAWWWRWPLKLVIIATTVFFVMNPYPQLFVRHARRWLDLNALVQPDEPLLQSWIDELRPRLEDIAPGPKALQIVESYVYEKVPYAWDWDTWGLADYFPTVAEVIQAGKEDCDGRAIVSASLLRSLGYKAELVADTVHMWVKTDRGETMSPGREGTFIEARSDGVSIRWPQLWQFPKSLAYGIAVFPLMRELFVVFVVWLLTMRGGVNKWTALVGLLMLLVGLMSIRVTSGNSWEHSWAKTIGQCVGASIIITALAALHVMQWLVRRESVRVGKNQCRSYPTG